MNNVLPESLRICFYDYKILEKYFMQIQTHKNVLNLWLSTQHRNASNRYSIESKNATNSLSVLLFILKRILKNILSLIFIIVFFPVVLLSSIDAYLDRISDNRIGRTM